MTKPIYIDEHISLSIEAKFPMTIGVGVVISVVSECWLSEKIGKT